MYLRSLTAIQLPSSDDIFSWDHVFSFIKFFFLTQIKPRSLRFTWSMKTTSSRDPNEIMAEIKKVIIYYLNFISLPYLPLQLNTILPKGVGRQQLWLWAKRKVPPALRPWRPQHRLPRPGEYYSRYQKSGEYFSWIVYNMSLELFM